MTRQQVTDLAQAICTENSEAIMSIARQLYFKISDELAKKHGGKKSMEIPITNYGIMPFLICKLSYLIKLLII